MIIIIYAWILILQSSDSSTIKMVKEVDDFIVRYCENNNRLPSLDVLQRKFPTLNKEIGCFFFTDDSTWLKVQYPVKWRNSEAIGEPKTSEFTATVYAYVLEYNCTPK